MTKGKVILAGAGPGDPELVTLKTLKYLQKAEVILSDRLVSPTLIEEYAHPKANIIYVGKQCAKGIHTPQEEINQLMVQYALQGCLVLRLKGGDAGLFSNVLDELTVLVQHGIEYEIIPGVSAAFGAGAYTGIPLTARDYSRGLRLLTLYNPESVTDQTWKDWSQTDDTLVFYMSGQKVNTLYKKFFENGVQPEKELAIIEQATTPFQKTTVYKFNISSDILDHQFGHVPTLIIVGKVVSLHHSYQWFKEDYNHIGSYFDQHKINMAYAV
jgi:uroporphyrin-III C-methyltransferase